MSFQELPHGSQRRGGSPEGAARVEQAGGKTFDGTRVGFLLPCVFQGPVQVVELGSKLLYLLSHIAAPFIVLSNLGFSLGDTASWRHSKTIQVS